MEVILGALGLFLTVGIPVFIHYRNKYKRRPKVEMELSWRRLSSVPKGLSLQNDLTQPYLEAETAIQVFELTYKVNLIVRNNSDIVAYYPVMIKPNDDSIIQFRSLTGKPIQSASEFILSTEFSTFEECQGRNRSTGKEYPNELKDFQVLLEYQNAESVKFYTLFTVNEKGSKNLLLTKHPRISLT